MLFMRQNYSFSTQSICVADKKYDYFADLDYFFCDCAKTLRICRVILQRNLPIDAQSVNELHTTIINRKIKIMEVKMIDRVPVKIWTDFALSLSSSCHNA